MDIFSYDRRNLVACHTVCGHCNLVVYCKVPRSKDKQKEQYFPDYNVARKVNHLLISKQGRKVAMITIDKKIAASQRRLGDVPVINYHRVPSRAQLTASLQETE